MVRVRTLRVLAKVVVSAEHTIVSALVLFTSPSSIPHLHPSDKSIPPVLELSPDFSHSVWFDQNKRNRAVKFLVLPMLYPLVMRVSMASDHRSAKRPMIFQIN